MSKYFSEKFSALVPYTPGEQPKDRSYVKLNTNESPFPPSSGVVKAVENEVGSLMLYSDPECYNLRTELAKRYKTNIDNVVVTNGSDEVLNFAFMAFSDKERPLAFPDITYGFYPVFAELNDIPYTEIPLAQDFSIKVEDYIDINKTIVIANPNAPTGLFTKLSEIERIIKSNPDNIVIVDEAYVDFGGESAVGLTQKYDNLLVCGTFSKSRSLAGARLGFGIGNKELIKDINTIRYSTNPYNVNRMTLTAGIAALKEDSYYIENCKKIMKNREYAEKELKNLGFEVIPSKANFLFAKSDKISGQELYEKLKEKGVLIRHFDKERILDYNRITIGTLEELQVLIEKITEILKEELK